MKSKQGSYPPGENPSLVGTGKALCAWCLQEQGKDLGNGSHGICKRHRGLVWKEHQAKKAERVSKR